MSTRLRTNAITISSILAIVFGSVIAVPASATVGGEPKPVSDSESFEGEAPPVPGAESGAQDADVAQSGDGSPGPEDPPGLDDEITQTARNYDLGRTPAQTPTMASEKGASPAQKAPAPKSSSKTSTKNVKAAPKVNPNNRCGIPMGVKTGHKKFKSKGTTRLSASGRASLSSKVFNRSANTRAKKQRAVFLASSTDFSRGAALTALAARFGWPVILTSGKSMDSKAKAAVKKVKPTHIFIAGGTATVSKSVERTARKLGTKDVKVKRFTGAPTTAAKKMATCFPAGTPAFVANAKNSSEALIATSAAVRRGGSLVLTNGYRPTTAAKKALNSLKSKKIYAIGGKWSSSTQKALRKSGAKKAKIRVFAGKNTYATSSRVATAFWPKSARKKVVYTRASSRLHGMTALNAARQANAPVLLTKQTCRPAEIQKVSKAASSHILIGSKKHLPKTAYSSTCQTTSDKVVAAAKSQNGKPYRWGAAGPHSFDCSGLTQYVHKKAGISIPRTSHAQWAAGKKVSNPRPGDIVVMLGGNHVALYLGNGMIIDAGTSRTGVVIRKIWSKPNAYVRFT